MINLENVPKNPGCYLFKDSRDKIIYVGKAKNLEKRVKSYFQKKDLDIKTSFLVSNISNIDFIVTDSEVEALILENNLIKKHKPKYNINLKDSKRYAYILLTPEEYPRLLIARNRENTKELKGKFYGPFVSGISRDYIIETLIKTFKIRTCKKLPKKECLRFSIGLCSAPCINKISKEDYLSSINSAEMVLKGKTKGLSKILYSKMKEASSIKNYEKALELKKQIKSLNDLEERQKTERQKNYDEDIINYIIKDEKVYLMIFSSVRGILESKQNFEFDYKEDFFEEFLSLYYSENKIPSEIIIPEKTTDSIKDYLEILSNKKVKINVPIKGEKKDLLELVKKNVEIMVLGEIKKVEELKISLNLNSEPKVIECFDISHLSGTSTVASMVQFRNGKEDKSNYRRFKISSVTGIDDYAAIKEVIRRRYTKLKSENLDFPDLIIIDGGKGQLSSTLEELSKLELKIPIISIAKKEEEIFEPGNNEPIILNKKSTALKYVQQIRDEAHRFAISYNRLLRSKKIRE